MEKMDALALQYEKLVEIGLHYDQKLWLIPSAAYSLLAAAYYGILSTGISQNMQVSLSTLTFVVFSGFTLQFVKDRAYQLGNQTAIDQIKHELGMVAVSEFAGIHPSRADDRWYIRRTRHISAASTTVYIMLLTLLFQLSCVAYFLYVAIV